MCMWAETQAEELGVCTGRELLTTTAVAKVQLPAKYASRLSVARVYSLCTDRCQVT